jgi:hypothetical protein
VTSCGAVIVKPALASTTAGVETSGAFSVGRVGLLFWHAHTATVRASAVDTLTDFSFMCSYRF